MSDNPVVVACPEGVWTKVATNVTSVLFHKLSTAPGVYKETYRLTGEDAPTNDADAIVIFVAETMHDVSHASAIDVYIKAVGAGGSVRRDA